MNSKATSKMDLSIIIVNWNSSDYLEKCLTSLKSTCQSIRHEVIVVDNASNEKLELPSSAEEDDIRILALEKNYGFGIANNKGVAIAQGRHLLFLNPDTVVTSPETLAKALEFAVNNPDYGCIGVKSLKDNGETQSDCARTAPTAMKLFMELTMLDLLFEKFGYARLFRLPLRKLFADQDVEIVSGCFMLIPSAVFQKVGGFRKDIFLYGEDADLCLRIRREDLRIRYMGTVSIIHSGSGAARKESFKAIVEHQCQGYYRLLQDHCGQDSARNFTFLLLLTLPVLIAIAPALDLYRILTGRRKHYLEIAKYWHGLIWSLRRVVSQRKEST